MSSAYIRQEICKSELPSDTGAQAALKHFVKSFRYKEKSVGLSTQPCFTPTLQWRQELKVTECALDVHMKCTPFRKRLIVN